MEKKINLGVNKVFRLQLDSMGGAGYSWMVEQNDEAVTEVTIGGNVREPRKGTPVGGSSKTKVTIKGLKAGTSHIRLIQKRIWEAEAPLKVKELLVSVTD